MCAAARAAMVDMDLPAKQTFQALCDCSVVAGLEARDCAFGKLPVH